MHQSLLGLLLLGRLSRINHEDNVIVAGRLFDYGDIRSVFFSYRDIKIIVLLQGLQQKVARRLLETAVSIP